MSSPTAVTQQGPFRRRTLILLIAVGVVSLGVALFLAAFADDFTDKYTSDTNGYSKSAIGYQGLIELLRAEDIPVIDSQHDSADRAKDGLLVVFAPDLELEGLRLDEMMKRAPRVLLVLPRWWGLPDPEHKGWILDRYEHETTEVQAVFDAAMEGSGDGYQEVRGAVGDGLGEMLWADPMPLPSIDPPVQVVTLETYTSEELVDVEISVGQTDALLFRADLDDDTEIWVLTDPSPLDNAGLRRPGNPEFAVALIDRLRDGGPVIFDETVHGFEDNPSLWKALFRFPLVLVSLHVLLGCVLILWAAVGRYGPPRASGEALPSGKDFLIRNTAELLHVGGHDADALRRYLLTTIYQTKTALHAPLDLDQAGVRTWLERVRAERGGSISIVELENEVLHTMHAKKSGATGRRIVELAARIHRWRTEMTHGPKHHP